MNINDILTAYAQGRYTKEELKSYLEDVGFSWKIVKALLKQADYEKAQAQGKAAQLSKEKQEIYTLCHDETQIKCSVCDLVVYKTDGEFDFDEELDVLSFTCNSCLTLEQEG